MDLMNSLLNLVVPPSSMVMLACAWPGLTFIRTFEWIYRYFSTENMEDKVVIITGASSGIGEQIAYEYAKRKAKLVLVARRDQRLRVISENARLMGANHVMIVTADVVKEDDCRRFVTETINYYGSVDHLVLTTSLGHTFYFEEVTDTSVFPHILDINFWGNVYPTLAALPYLHQSNGRIIVNASVENWLPLPRMSLYASAKVALITFYESLRFELSDEVGITIATHGWDGMEMARGRLMLEEGAEIQWKEEREVHVSGGPVENYARMIATGACRGEAYVKFSSWRDIFLLYRSFVPNLLNWTLQLLIAQNDTRRTSLVGTGRPLLEAASPTKLLVSPASPYSPQHSQQQKME